METFYEVVPTELGDVLVHYNFYPNKSAFIWITSPDNPVFNDMHVATPFESSEIPSVSTRLGEKDSIGRSIALQLCRKFRVPFVVSWSLKDEFGGQLRTIESMVFFRVGTEAARDVMSVDS
jgi:hypothetical protein